MLIDQYGLRQVRISLVWQLLTKMHIGHLSIAGGNDSVALLETIDHFNVAVVPPSCANIAPIGIAALRIDNKHPIASGILNEAASKQQ